MGFNSFHFLKSPAMVASLYLLLLLFLLIILVILISWCSISTAAFMTLISMLVSTSFPFIFSKLKQSIEAHKSSPKESSEIMNLPASDQKVALSSGCLVSEDLNLCRSSKGSQGSISDDESLIEIDLSDGQFDDSSEASSEALRLGIMELLSEINDEDNLIEIDIAMGSIKCPRLEAKA